MQLLTHDKLSELTKHFCSPCISFYVPLSGESNASSDLLELGNLIKKTRLSLLESGESSSLVESLLAPIAALAGDDECWDGYYQGLAIYSAPGYFECFGLHQKTVLSSVVNGRFHLTPVLSELSDGNYFLLVANKGGVKLFEGTRHTFVRRELPGAPENLDDYLANDPTGRQLQLLGEAGELHAPGQKRRGSGLQSSARAVEEMKRKLSGYFRAVDRALRHVAERSDAPLILSGPSYAITTYRQTSQYPHIIRPHILGSLDHFTQADLHEISWGMASHYFEEEQERALRRLHVLLGTQRASADLAEILPATADGRVEVLYLTDEEAVHLLEHDDDAYAEQLNTAVAETVTFSGSLYLVPPGSINGDRKMAAVFRY